MTTNKPTNRAASKPASKATKAPTTPPTPPAIPDEIRARLEALEARNAELEQRNAELASTPIVARANSRKAGRHEKQTYHVANESEQGTYAPYGPYTWLEITRDILKNAGRDVTAATVYPVLDAMTNPDGTKRFANLTTPYMRWKNAGRMVARVAGLYPVKGTGADGGQDRWNIDPDVVSEIERMFETVKARAPHRNVTRIAWSEVI